MNRTITISNDINIEIKITRVFVERCCGTWCVKLQDFNDTVMRVAAIEDDYLKEGSRAAAEQYARELAKLLGVDQVDLED